MEQLRIPTITLNTGHVLPLLGLGTWPLTDAEATEVVPAALAQGYRLVDTAARYGNEAGVGRGIAAAGLPRAELFVTTKLRGRDHGYATTQAALRHSLEALGLDYVDLFLIHWPLPRVDKYVESYRAILDLVGEGLVRSAGVSNFKRHHLQRLIDETGVAPAVDQIQLSPALPRPAIRAYLAEQGIATQAWSPLGLPEGVLDAPIVADLAAKYGRSPAQIILRWHVQQGISAIPKSADPGRQRENATVFDFALDAGEVAALAALDVGEATARDADSHEIF
ncbi:MAG: aldo/keto reductase [Thermomicrobiales bacterium]